MREDRAKDLFVELCITLHTVPSHENSVEETEWKRKHSVLQYFKIIPTHLSRYHANKERNCSIIDMKFHYLLLTFEGVSGNDATVRYSKGKI
jgi:hypothetical protein